MLRIRNFLPLVAAALVGVAVLGAPTQADAAFAVRFQSGINSLTIVDGSTQDGNPGDSTRISVNSMDATVAAFIAASGFDISGSTFSFRNGSNGGSVSVLTEAETEVTRTGPGFATLSITTGYDGFTLPVGSPLYVDSTVAFSAINTTIPGSSYVFQNWADNVPPAQNLVTPTGVSGQTGVFVFTSVIPPGSVPSLLTPESQFNRTTTPFQVTERSTLVLSTNDFVSFTATTTVVAVPAPAGLVLALTAVPFLGLGAWVRRRRVQIQA